MVVALVCALRAGGCFGIGAFFVLDMFLFWIWGVMRFLA